EQEPGEVVVGLGVFRVFLDGLTKGFNGLAIFLGVPMPIAYAQETIRLGESLQVPQVDGYLGRMVVCALRRGWKRWGLPIQAERCQFGAQRARVPDLQAVPVYAKGHEPRPVGTEAAWYDAVMVRPFQADNFTVVVECNQSDGAAFRFDGEQLSDRSESR